MISGFRRSLNEIFALPGIYSAFIFSELRKFRQNSHRACLALEDGADKLSQNVANCQFILPNIP